MSSNNVWQIETSPLQKAPDVVTTICEEDAKNYQKLAKEIEALIEIQRDYGWLLTSQQEDLDCIETSLQQAEIISEETSETLTDTVDKVDTQRRAGIYAAGGGVVGGITGFLLGSIGWIAGPHVGIPMQVSFTVLGAGGGASGAGLLGMMKRKKPQKDL